MACSIGGVGGDRLNLWGRERGKVRKAVIEKHAGVLPFIGTFEERKAEFPALSCGGSGKGVPCLIGPSGFGWSHSGISTEQFVVISHSLNSNCGTKIVDLRLCHVAEGRNGEKVVKEGHEIASSGALNRSGKSVRIPKSCF